MPSPASQAPPTGVPARFGGLDGLRAVAVLLVLVYHLFPGTLRGGYLGVDVFFVISGFLISSLLLRELETNGRVRLGAFWRRRARRLLPALALVLLVCTALGAAVGGDVLVGVGAQIAGATFFVNNWLFIANGIDYFAKDTPELLRNTWSLSIEEQFYLVLPLLLIAAFTLRRPTARAVPFLALGGVSALLMVQLSVREDFPTRIYFGSDTHAFGLLFGVALACLLHHRAAAPAARPGRSQQLLYLGVALAGAGCLGWLAATLPEASSASFQGGFQLATLAALAAVWAVTRPGALVGQALDMQPMRWIGERSYGIYLWHWPLLVLFNAASPPWAASPAATWLTGFAALAATVIVSALSYSFIEQPVRRLGLRRSLSLLFRPRLYTLRRGAIAVSIGLVVVITVPSSIYAVWTAPSHSTAADAITRGQQALEEGVAGSGEDAVNSDSEGADEETAPPVTVDVEGRDISAIGDSVMLASVPELEAAFAGIRIDATVSRGLAAGVGVADEQRSSGDLRRVLVVGLGTNGPVQQEDLGSLRKLAGDRPVVLVNAHGERDWIPGVNKTLADFAEEHRGVVLADWDGRVESVPGALAGDGIHPNPSGGAIYAESVRRALDELASPGEAIGYATPRR